MKANDLEAACEEAVLTLHGEEPEELAAVLREYEPPRRPSRGRPARNAYLAAEVAFMLDVEGRPQLDGSPPSFEVWAYLGARGQGGKRLKLEEVTWRRDTKRCRAITRVWRDDGREVMAALGAWPWAVSGAEGRLSRTWWREARYAASLAAWHRGDPQPA